MMRMRVAPRLTFCLRFRFRQRRTEQWHCRHGDRVDIAQAHLQYFHGLLSTGEGNVKIPFMLNDVRIVDLATTDEVEHLREDEAVGADGERERDN